VNSQVRNAAGDLCTSPLLPGKVHCGYMRSATRLFQSLVTPNAPSVGNDLCTLLLQGVRCDAPPHLVVSGFSQGSAIAPLFLMMFDHLTTQLGVPLDAAETTVRLWAPVSAYDSGFTASYTRRFGAATLILAHNADFITTLSALGTGTDYLADVVAHMDTTSGTCIGTFRECARVCRPGVATMENAVDCFLSVATLPLNRAAHELPILEMPNTASTFFQVLNEPSVLDNAYYLLDSLFAPVATSECIEDIFDEYVLDFMCPAVADDEPNSFVALRDLQWSGVVAWCDAFRTLLADADVDAWDRLCCMKERLDANPFFRPPAAYVETPVVPEWTVQYTRNVGSYTVSPGGQYTVNASGLRTPYFDFDVPFITKFYFMGMEVERNFKFTATFVVPENTTVQNNFGLMARTSLEEGAPYVALVKQDNFEGIYPCADYNRMTAGGNFNYNRRQYPLPHDGRAFTTRMTLSRSTNIFTSECTTEYDDDDGVVHSFRATMAFDAPTRMYVGMAFTPNGNCEDVAVCRTIGNPTGLYATFHVQDVGFEA
jgi:hypothetical protein